jgi:hypothetical protein
MQYSLPPSKPKRFSLSRFFIGLAEKIELYEDHVRKTNAFYEHDLKPKLDALEQEYKADSVQAQEQFEKVNKEWDGEEHFRYVMAMHESGLDNLDEGYQYQQELVREPYEEMLDYINKASLILLYSLLESSLKRLCELLKEMEKTRISVADFGDYIAGSMKYLDLVIGLPRASLEPFETKITHIQYVRNRIVHNHSEFDMEDDSTLNEIISASKPYLIMVESPDEPVRTLKIYDPAYIFNSYQVLKDYFNELFWLINKKYGYPIINDKIAKVFQASLGAIEVTNTQVDNIKGGKKLTASITYTAKDAQAPTTISAKISITRSSKFELNITDQTGNADIAKWKSDSEAKDTRIKYALWGIVTPEPDLKIEILIF